MLTESAIRMASEVEYRGLGTWEFLVDAEDTSTIAFIETNARLQVEHTVTEEVTGVDLVRSQILIAGGSTLAELNLEQDDVPQPRGFAVQCRVNTETMNEEGMARPAGGTFSTYQTPSGPGIRTDSYGYQGYATNPNFDSLIAKVIAYSPTNSFGDAIRRAKRALTEFRVEGVRTNIEYLLALLSRTEVQNNEITTSFINEFAPELLDAANQISVALSPADEVGATSASDLAGAQVSNDPLAVLQHGDIDQRTKSESIDLDASSPSIGPDGTKPLEAPLQGTIISVDVEPGDEVAAGQPVVVMEAMNCLNHDGNRSLIRSRCWGHNLRRSFASIH